MSAPDFLRRLVRNMNACNESFNERFTVSELIIIHGALASSEWDILPDQWEERQIQEALVGTIPQWDENEEAVYGEESAA